jgi:sarcosine oxidase subunit alpha
MYPARGSGRSIDPCTVPSRIDAHSLSRRRRGDEGITFRRAMPPRRIDPQAVAPGSVLAASIAARRTTPVADDVTIEHDGAPVPARGGESLALALMGSGVAAVSRSIKFHRPRGPMCLRGACDGCLVRLNGVPNVMACRVAARAGDVVTSQNAFPNARVDLLRMTDWFFPEQFDHHHLMVRFGPAVNRAMQVFARRMAGMGNLPDRTVAPVEPEAIDCDALVVGAGPAGLAAATELARSGARVLCVEEEANPGGTLLDEPGQLAGGVLGPAFAHALAREAARAGVTLRTHACATATFDNATVVITPERALLVRARARLFANGAYEGVGAFDGNDLPGVYTARAAARALAHGVLVGGNVVVAGRAWPAAALAESLAAAGARVEPVGDAPVTAAKGTRAVTGVEIDTTASGTAKRARRRALRCDALIVALDPTPAYELLGEAGVAARPDEVRRCFVPEVAEDGRTERGDVFAAGSVCGGSASIGDVDLARPMEASGPVADGRRAARSMIALLAGSAGRAQVVQP